MLTDTHVDNFLFIISDYYSNEPNSKSFCYLSSTFFSLGYSATEDSINFIVNFRKDVDLMFFPVCFHAHWVLFVLRRQEWDLELYNSLDAIPVPLAIWYIVCDLCQYIFEDPRVPLWRHMRLPKSLQQRDYISCGVFLCNFIEQIVSTERVYEIANFNIEVERLRIDLIFYIVSITTNKPFWWLGMGRRIPYRHHVSVCSC